MLGGGGWHSPYEMKAAAKEDGTIYIYLTANSHIAFYYVFA